MEAQMTRIAVLVPDEAVRIDVQRLEQIVGQLGEEAGARVIGTALEQLAVALRRTAEAARDENLAAIVTDADHLSRLAWQIGLVTLAGVAVDVGACAERGDRMALAATVARLERTGNRSLTRIWDTDGAS